MHLRPQPAPNDPNLPKTIHRMMKTFLGAIAGPRYPPAQTRIAYTGR